MRESTQSHITYTLYYGEAISGALLIQAIEAAQTLAGFRVYFGLVWDDHYLDDKECRRARILRVQSGRNPTGNPKYSYGFFLTTSYKLCHPLVIDPDGQYEQLYLVVDSWGANFIQQRNNEGFLDSCRKQGRKLNGAIQEALRRTMPA